jgi:hypothetical protein
MGQMAAWKQHMVLGTTCSNRVGQHRSQCMGQVAIWKQHAGELSTVLFDQNGLQCVAIAVSDNESAAGGL